MTSAVFKTVAGIILASAALVFSTAASGAETWLQCEGAVATTDAGNKTMGESAPAKDVFAYNDETKHLFRYAEARKTLDLVFVTDYGQSQIKWGAPVGASYGDVRWEGVLDRGAPGGSITVKITRREKDQIMTWSEGCKQIPPIN